MLALELYKRNMERQRKQHKPDGSGSWSSPSSVCSPSSGNSPSGSSRSSGSLHPAGSSHPSGSLQRSNTETPKPNLRDLPRDGEYRMPAYQDQLEVCPRCRGNLGEGDYRTCCSRHDPNLRCSHCCGHWRHTITFVPCRRCKEQGRSHGGS